MADEQRFDWKSFTPDDSPKTPVDLMNDPGHRDLAMPDCEPGDVAPDFELPLFDFSDGTRVETGQTMRLSERAAHRPVALLFGSYT